jgi:rhomboid-like protein
VVSRQIPLSLARSQLSSNRSRTLSIIACADEPVFGSLVGEAMNNVWTIASRSVGLCLRNPAWSRDSPALRGGISLLSRGPSFYANASSLRAREDSRDVSRHVISKWHISTVSFSHESRRAFHESCILRKLKPYKEPKGEQGLRFQKGELSPEELKAIFGTACPPAIFANRLLRILHGRRVDGTLDLPPPDDIQRGIDRYPDAVPDALQWLQKNYPIDEEAAIEARIRREEAAAEQENPAVLMQRAEDLGLYKPQSGRYQAPLSEKEGDVFGQSQLDKIRAKNMEKAAKEEEELEQQISQIQANVEARQDQSTALTKQTEHGVEVAQEGIPQPNEFDKWVLRAKNRATSKLTLESPEVVRITAMQRLLPSFIFVVIVTGLSYLFAQYWVPPKRSERIMYDTSLSFATVAGIFAANMLIYTLWKFPPMWRLLNRYCVSVPGQPRALSMVGNIFSHQGIYHLCLNMAWMFLLGLSLHEDVGRGTFLGIYFASGAISSYASLANFVAKGIYTTSSMGASGAVSGIVAAYCMIHAKYVLISSIAPDRSC